MYLRVTHFTGFTYTQPVSFAPHAIYLRPRETSRQRLHRFSLVVQPSARLVAASDPADNPLDWAFFAPAPATGLEFRTEAVVETLDTNPFDFFLLPHALTFPFFYDLTERTALAPYLAPRADSPLPAVLRDWLGRHLPDPPRETVPFLMALNSTLHAELRYTPRDEPGIQTAMETMSHGSGSCRDFAVFLVELCRMLGIAARFVSGYLYEAPLVNAQMARAPAMHAWAEVYLPGAGWRGLDPTRGIFCDDAFVHVAHAAIGETVNPIQGTFYGGANAGSRLMTSLQVEKIDPPLR